MASTAIVARSRHDGLEYLVRTAGGVEWGRAEREANTFQNVHEATRAAMRLPAKLRAFAMPLPAGAR